MFPARPFASRACDPFPGPAPPFRGRAIASFQADMTGLPGAGCSRQGRQGRTLAQANVNRPRISGQRLDKCREYGKAGDLTGNDREHVEVSALALHLVQAAIVYLNIHMIQIVLRDPKWRAKLTDADRRGLSALFWSHLNLYGRFELDMNRFLDLGIEEAGPVTSTVAGP